MKEVKIPISKLLLYPVRGIKAIEVESLSMTPGGAKFDRQWILVRTSSNKYIALHTTPKFTRLRQKLIFENGLQETPTKLELSVIEGECLNLETRKIYVDVKREYHEKDHLTAKKLAGKKFANEGFMESSKVNEWLSSVLEEDVVMMRAV